MKKMKNLTISLIVPVLLSACSTLVPVIDVSKIPPETLQAAYRVQTFTIDSAATRPEVSQYLGVITVFSCKHMVYDPPASTGNALTQLRLKALDMGADGVIDITFDTRGTDTWGTNCWESVQASGIAVKFAK